MAGSEFMLEKEENESFNCFPREQVYFLVKGVNFDVVSVYIFVSGEGNSFLY